jgi:hypothetical protein
MGNRKIIGSFQNISGKADSVLTTKADLATYSTERIRIGVGSNNQSLIADSAQALGLKWGASATSTLTSAGDLLVASGANTLSRLARGSDNQVLKMNGTSLNWESAGATGWETIENHVASGTESTYTFDIDEATDDNSMLVLVYDLAVSASLAFQMKVNDVTNYNSDGSLINAGSQTIINSSADSEIEIASTTILSAEDMTACGTIQIFTLDSGTTRPLVISQATGQNTSALEVVSSLVVGSATSITKIEVKSSTSTWKANSKFTLYRVKR